MTPFDLDHTAFVIGDPIAQSLSPLLHTPWLQALASPPPGRGRYGRILVKADQLGDFVMAFRESQAIGFNITAPHKEAIIPHLDRLSPAAKAIGAVNTVVRKGRQLVGYNTDGIGWLTYLKKSAPHWVQERPVILWGAGGAARAILHTLLTTKTPVVMVANRSPEKAQILVNDLGRGRAVVLDQGDAEQALLSAGLLINSTVCGMVGKPDLTLDISPLPADAVVNDIVYQPYETVLLKNARKQGLTGVDGLGMLIHQGAAAFKLWFGLDPQVDDGLYARLLDHMKG